MASASAAPPGGPKARVEIYVAARTLPNKDVTSKTDGFIELYVRGPTREWVLVDRSETVRDNLDPVFAHQFVLEYRFEEEQPLKWMVWDDDGPTKRDFICAFETTLGRIMGSRNHVLETTIACEGSPRPCSLRFTGAEIAGTNDRLQIQFRASSLDKKDWGLFGGSSDPFLTILRPMRGAAPVKVWESPVIKKNLNPVWQMASIPVQVLCNGDPTLPLTIQCWDWDSDGGHDFIGACTASLNDLLGAPTAARQFPFLDPAKAGKSSYRNSGILTVTSATILRQPTFLEYIRGGCEINVVVGVDFTGSNGDPRVPTSLHFGGGATPNQYVQALTAVGRILLDYDQDKMIPAFGFGGQIGGVASHCFALNGNGAHPEVPGLDGLLAAYRQAIANVPLYGPTYFAPIIRRASEMALGGGPNKYTVLLILTDGQMNDQDDTVDAIIEASGLPLSIIIVGVGAADFTSMEFLDSDGAALTNGRRVASRDIVQFVPFVRFAALGAESLAREVLAEVPNQLVSYFTLKGIAPTVAPPISALHPVGGGGAGMATAGAMGPPGAAGGAGGMAGAVQLVVPTTSRYI